MKSLPELRKMALEKKLPLKIGMYFLGTVVTCLGTALLTLNGWGSDAMNTLFVAIAEKCGIRSGDVYTIFNTSMLLLGFLFARQYMGIGSVLMILIQGFFINRWILALGELPWLFQQLPWKIAVAVLSYLCRCFGGALSTSVCLGTAGFEACLFTLADHIKVEYKYLKLISEAVFFGTALFLHSVYGIMTVVSVALYGYGLSFFMIGLNRTVWKRWGIADERNELSRNRRRRAAR